MLQNNTPGCVNLAPMPTREGDMESHGAKTSSTEEAKLRSPQWTTASQHRNLHHLPRSAMEHSQACCMHLRLMMQLLHRVWTQHLATVDMAPESPGGSRTWLD